MGKLFSFLNAIFLGTIAAIGVFFNIEQRRMDNYQALYTLITDRPDAEWSLDQEAVDAFSNSTNCAPLTLDPGSDGFDSGALAMRCPLTHQHRFILNRLVAEKRDRSSPPRAVAYAERPSPAERAPASESERAESQSDQFASARPSTPEARERRATIQPEQQRELIVALNSPSRDTRRVATAQIEQDALGVPGMVALLVEEIADESRLDALTAQGRFNVLYLLNRTPDDVWTPELLARAAAGTELMRARSKDGRAAIGDQTRQELGLLDARITRLSGRIG